MSGTSKRCSELDSVTPIRFWPAGPLLWAPPLDRRQSRRVSGIVPRRFGRIK